MFYSELILAKRGPLAKVWLAAHMERKLSKAQTIHTDIEEATDAIMGDQAETMALRLSGQLLLGVVRIYSRKARYLLEDCNEALLRIKMAYRPGVVDMTDDQLRVNSNAITLPIGNLDPDVLLPDLPWDQFTIRPFRTGGNGYEGSQADITLSSAQQGLYDQDFDNFADFDYQIDFGPLNPNDDDEELDLGIDFGESMEIGRDGPASEAGRESLADHLGTYAKGASSELDFGGAEIDGGLNFGDAMDVDLELGIGFGDGDFRLHTPGQTREGSRTSTPGPQTPKDSPVGPSVTPKAKRAPRGQKQIIDEVTELSPLPALRGRNGNTFGAPIAQDVSSITKDYPSLPQTAYAIHVQEILRDPIGYYMPSAGDGLINFAPKGLSKELHALFIAPARTGGSPLKRKADASGIANKKARLGTEDDDDVEQARRQSIAPSFVVPGSVAGELDFDHQFETAGLDMDFEGGFDVDVSKRSITSTPAPGQEDECAYGDTDCTISMFGISQTQTQGANELELPADPNEGKGYSKNTVKALGVLRRELKPTDHHSDQGKFASFEAMSKKASRRAASSFFFELLVLGTRDCIKLHQSKPFSNIKIEANEKLWESQRHDSVDRSIAV